LIFNKVDFAFQIEEKSTDFSRFAAEVSASFLSFILEVIDKGVFFVEEFGFDFRDEFVEVSKEKENLN